MTAENTPAPVDTGKPWFDGADAETVGYLQNRGLDKLPPNEAALKAVGFHREAEKFLGAPADKLARLPKDEADVATRDALWTKLGRPTKPEEYDFSEAGEVPPEFKAWMAATYHKNGLTKAQVAGIMRETVARLKSENETRSVAQQAKLQEEDAKLNTEWGARKAANELVATRTMEKLGYTKEDVDALISVRGRAAVYRQFHNLGAKIGEDEFVRSEGPAGGAMTKEQAIERISALKADKAFRQRYLNGDVEARKQMNDLHMVASGFAGA